MRLSHDSQSVAAQARAVRERIVRTMSAVTARFGMHKRLFLGEDGQPTPDAVAFLRDQAAFAFADRPAPIPGPSSGLSLERIEGRRDMYFRLTGALRLDGAKLAILHERLMEAEDE